MDKARVEYWKRNLAAWTRERLAFRDRSTMNSPEPEYIEARRLLVKGLGGPPTPEEMRVWLNAEFASRDADAEVEPVNEKITVAFLRHQTCPHCEDSTTQTMHGGSVSGGLWKATAAVRNVAGVGRFSSQQVNAAAEGGSLVEPCGFSCGPSKR